MEWEKKLPEFRKKKIFKLFSYDLCQTIVKFDLYIFTVELIHLLKKIRFWKIRTPGSIIVETPVVILDLESAVRSSMIMFLVLLLVLKTSSTGSRVSRSKQSNVNIQIQVQQRYLVTEVRIKCRLFSEKNSFIKLNYNLIIEKHCILKKIYHRIIYI